MNNLFSHKNQGIANMHPQAEIIFLQLTYTYPSFY